MTQIPVITFQILFYQIMGALVGKYRSECLCTFPRELIYMKQKAHQTCQPLEDFPVANAPDFFSHLNQL